MVLSAPVNTPTSRPESAHNRHCRLIARFWDERTVTKNCVVSLLLVRQVSSPAFSGFELRKLFPSTDQKRPPHIEKHEESPPLFYSSPESSSNADSISIMASPPSSPTNSSVASASAPFCAFFKLSFVAGPPLLSPPSLP